MGTSRHECPGRHLKWPGMGLLILKSVPIDINVRVVMKRFVARELVSLPPDLTQLQQLGALTPRVSGLRESGHFVTLETRTMWQ